MVIIWNDNLITGIPLIDEQHKALFKTIEKLDKCKENESIFYEILAELKEYVLVHFKTEEEYMRYTGYSDYNHHKDSHDKFKKDFKKILRAKSSEGSMMDSRQEVIVFIEDWLKHHYENEDVEMAAYLNKKAFKP